MKNNIAILVSALAPTFLLTSCIIEPGGAPGNPSAPAAPGYASPGQPPGSGGAMTAVVGQGQVIVMQGGQVVSTLRTAAPNVEAQHFTAGQQEIVIKSRGNHGAANVELFDVRTGILRDKVLAYAIENGQPAWARGMED